FINLGKDVNRTAKQSVYVSLNEDGTITGEVTGRYKRYALEANRITLQLDGIADEFEGVMQWQWNEAAGKLVPVFTALAKNGVSIWGSKLQNRTSRQVMQDVAASLSLPTSAKDGVLDLPSRGTRAANIAWSSSDEGIIAADGTVTRPNAGEGDRVVTL